MKVISALLLTVLLAGCSSQPVTVYSDDNVVFSGSVTHQTEGILHVSVGGDGTTCTGSLKIPDGPSITDGEITCDDGRRGAFVATVANAYSVGVGRLDGRAAFAMLIEFEEKK